MIDTSRQAKEKVRSVKSEDLFATDDDWGTDADEWGVGADSCDGSREVWGTDPGGWGDGPCSSPSENKATHVGPADEVYSTSSQIVSTRSYDTGL